MSLNDLKPIITISMENDNDTLSFLEKYITKLELLIKSLTGNWITPKIIVDDLVRRITPKRMFEDDLYFLNKNIKKFTFRIHVVAGKDNGYSPIIKELSHLVNDYLQQYELNIKKTLFSLIIEEQNQSPIRTKNYLLQNNQYRKLKDICISINLILQKFEDKSIISEMTGFECYISEKIIYQAYPKLLNEYIEAEKSNYIAVFKPETLPHNFKPIIWKKYCTKNKYINKKSLGDLLRIITGNQELDIPKINRLFAHPKGGSINVKSSNFFNNKGKTESEFYDDLISIFFPK